MYPDMRYKRRKSDLVFHITRAHKCFDHLLAGFKLYTPREEVRFFLNDCMCKAKSKEELTVALKCSYRTD